MTTLSTTVQEHIALPASARGFGGPDSGGGPSASDVLVMLRRRAVLIVVLFLFFAALAGGGFALWWFQFPGYRAEALIECVSNIPDAALSLDQKRLEKDEHERFVMTQAMLLESPSILGEALKVTSVRETQWFRSARPNEQLLELTDDLMAAPVRGTNFLRVAMECREPTDAAIIVNEVVDQWFRTVKKRSAEEFADEALESTRQERDGIEREVESDRDRLKALAARLPPGATQDPGGNITNQEVKQYGEQVATKKLELAELEQYRAAYNDPERVAATAEDVAVVEQDPQVAELNRAVYLLQQQRAADANVYGPEHAVIKQLDAQLEAAEMKLAERRIEKLRRRQADIREAANAAYENGRHALFLAEENLAKAEAALQDQDRLLFDYNDMQVQLDRKVRLAQALADRIRSLTRVKTGRTAINVNIAQPAVDPLERSSPSLLLIPVGVFLALTLSIGLALGLEFLDKSVRTTQDVVRHLDIALLGLVPHTDDEEVAIAQVEAAVRDAPKSMVAEAFRQIRTNLQFTAPSERQRTVLVTSPRPDDGKTTVACNLAMAVAQGGRRVLLIDANFRRPAVPRVFPDVRGPGLSNLLVGDGNLSACIHQTTIPRLDVLGGGPTPPNPVELLAGEACHKLLQEAAAQYDQVIIDTPPVLLASDAMVLATVVDGVVLVVRANRSSRGVARRACTLLADGGAHVFGAVLNAAQVTRGGYFREQLRTYYEYQADADAGGAILPTGPKKA